LQEVTVSGEVADEITPPTGVDCDDRSRQYVPTLIASGSVRFWPPEVTTSACGPATSVVFTVSVAVIEVAGFTTTFSPSASRSAPSPCRRSGSWCWRP
jgi:hypothetical protein